MRQMMTDTRDPAAVARPIGRRVPGNQSEVKYAPGSRARQREMMLCRNENSDRPLAQK